MNGWIVRCLFVHRRTWQTTRTLEWKCWYTTTYSPGTSTGSSPAEGQVKTGTAPWTTRTRLVLPSSSFKKADLISEGNRFEMCVNCQWFSVVQPVPINAVIYVKKIFKELQIALTGEDLHFWVPLGTSQGRRVSDVRHFSFRWLH